MEQSQYPAALVNLINMTAARLLDKDIKKARFLALLNNSHALPSACHIIKITGTNGKGSVCAMLSACLAADHKTVGLFTSPHLFEINERICINGQAVSDATLALHATAMETLVHALVAQHGVDYMPSFFEVLIVMALRIFEAAGVQFAIFEAGIGGYSDATHWLPSMVSAITSIGMDHMAQLGPTLVRIAEDKAGIAFDGTPLILGPRIGPDLVATISAACDGKNVRIIASDMDCTTIAQDFKGTHLRFELPDGPLDCRLSLIGPHQVDNAKVVLRLLQWLHENRHISNLLVLEALQHTVWAGRMEYLPGAPAWLFDVAHNAHAFEAIGASMDALIAFDDRIVVYGASEEKDYRSCIPYVTALAPAMCIVGGFNKAVAANELAECFQNGLKDAARIVATSDALDACIRQLMAEPDNSQRTIIVLGSVYLVGAARKIVFDAIQ